MRHIDTKSIYTTIGGGSAGTDPFAGGGAAEVRKATLTIQLTERGTRPRKQAIENDIRTALQQLPGVRTKVGLGGSGEKYVLVLTGEDPQALQTAAMAVERDLRTIQGLGSIASTASLVRPEIAVRPDFAKAADLGVTSATIVGHSLGGGVAMQFTYQHPDYCRRLILISSGGLGQEVGLTLRLLSAPGAEFILPIIAPSLIGVALFGFTLSYDEFARTLLTAGSYNTLPLEIFGMTTNVTTPVIYALGTLTTVVSFAVMGLALGLRALLAAGTH